jgi:hypothetical protein
MILEMNEMMDKISRNFINLWKKFITWEDKIQSAEMLLMLARFCDFVLGFEVEAETLYIKATSLLNSSKLE